MAWEGWYTLAVIAAMAGTLLTSRIGPDMVMLAGLAMVMTAGLLSSRLPGVEEAVAGFGNEGLVTIAALFIVAEGLRQTGAMSRFAAPWLGRPRSVADAQRRLLPPVALLSAFMNNTPVVAMFMPVVSDWSRRTRIAASKLFIPLSYAAILGGTCTLIGTSTNVIVYGMMREQAAHAPHSSLATAATSFGMFTLAWVGVPALIGGLVYMWLASPRLLPERQEPTESLQDARKYSVEMLVEQGGPIDGKTIEKAGLRHLPGGYLAEIEREGKRLVGVEPDEVLRGGDRLIFVGVVNSMVDLRNLRGLKPASNQVFKLAVDEADRRLIEAVVSDRCPLLHETIRAGRFRSVYDAVVIAVHRRGQHLQQKIGDIRLQAGDTLLIEANPSFVERQRARRDFHLVSAIDDSRPVRHGRAWVAMGITIAMVAAVTFAGMPLLVAALLAGLGMLALRCCTGEEARQSIDWRALLVIGAALGVGRALHGSGAAEAIADALLGVTRPMGPLAMLAAIYLVTMLFNIAIGHAGAAVLAFPIAQAVALQHGYDFMPFAIVIMMAASAEFAWPTSYPTHLMVFGVGGYRFADYLRFGLPLNLIVMLITLAVIAVMWPLG